MLAIGMAFCRKQVEEYITVGNSCVTGNIYVILGEDFSYDNPYDQSILNGKNGYRIENVNGCSHLGFSVANADVNDNGRDDVIIGSGAKTDGGDVYVVIDAVLGTEFQGRIEL